MITKVLDNLKVKLNTRGVAFTHLHSDNEFASRQLADWCMKNGVTSHVFSGVYTDGEFDCGTQFPHHGVKRQSSHVPNNT